MTDKPVAGIVRVFDHDGDALRADRHDLGAVRVLDVAGDPLPPEYPIARPEHRHCGLILFNDSRECGRTDDALRPSNATHAADHGAQQYNPRRNTLHGRRRQAASICLPLARPLICWTDQAEKAVVLNVPGPRWFNDSWRHRFGSPPSRRFGSWGSISRHPQSAPIRAVLRAAGGAVSPRCQRGHESPGGGCNGRTVRGPLFEACRRNRMSDDIAYPRLKMQVSKSLNTDMPSSTT